MEIEEMEIKSKDIKQIAQKVKMLYDQKTKQVKAGLPKVWQKEKKLLKVVKSGVPKVEKSYPSGKSQNN